MIWCHHQLEIVAMKRRVHSRTWNRELLHWWKEVHETLWKMASEQTCRIVKPSGCARYRARVFRTTVCVPAEIRLARSGWNWVVSWCFRPFTQGMEAFLLQHTFRTFIHGYITGEIHYEHQVKIWSITAACRSAPGSGNRCTCRFDLSDNQLCIWKCTERRRPVRPWRNLPSFISVWPTRRECTGTPWYPPPPLSTYEFGWITPFLIRLIGGSHLLSSRQRMWHLCTPTDIFLWPVMVSFPV